MSIKDLGKLAKLKIIAGNDEKNTFDVLFNPESYSEKFSVLYKERESANSEVEQLDYVKSIPQDFSLNIIIDTTGVTDFSTTGIPGLSSLTENAYQKVNKFLKLAWMPVNGKPNPLEIKWGEFSFHCYLKDVNIKYTLFNREGAPLRAELNATFIGNSEKNLSNYNKRFGASFGSGTSSVSANTTSTASNNSTPSDTTVSSTQNGIVISVA
jgi:hypothetical protein